MLRITLEGSIPSLLSAQEKTTEVAEEAVSVASALILNRIRTRFLDQVTPDGQHWEPSYAAFLRSFNGRGGGTLFDTGNLFHSIQVYSVSPLEKSIATDVPYAPFLQYGTPLMPAREFLGFNSDDEKLAYAVLEKKLKEAF